MNDLDIYQRTAKGRAHLREPEGGVTRELDQALRLIDGRRSVRDLTADMGRIENANFLLSVQALEKRGFVRIDPTIPAARTHADPEPLGDANSSMVELTELGPEESVFAWAAASRGAQELQQNGYFSNPMRGDREHPVNAGGPRRALVVDDEPSMVDLITVALEEQGYQVTGAHSFEGAMRALKSEAKPDIVLLDVRMPGRDGFAVLTAIRADRELADVPVIMVTAQTSNEHVHQGLTLGADGYIFKPIKWEKLLECIVGVVGR